MNAWPLFVLPALGACAGVAAWGAVSPTSQLFGPALHRTPSASLIALTFDDGPNPAYTPQFLSLLERYGAPATFFLVGRFAQACPQLVREIADRGHSIGNHTQTHVNLAWLPAWRIADELRACQDSILRALGFERDAAPILIRPPFGYRGPQLWSAMRTVGLRGVAMWSLTCYDWKPQPAARLIKRLGLVAERSGLPAAAAAEKNSHHAGESLPATPGAEQKSSHGEERRANRGGEGPPPATAGTKEKSHHGGEVVVLHDGDARQLGADRRHVLAALEYWLPRWRDAGFEFVTMNSLVGASSPRVS
jgi:peptidoglycan/xylan/chitin deacetylase (PgdA/CDA1 family)